VAGRNSVFVAFDVDLWELRDLSIMVKKVPYIPYFIK
jgi:hypothetical protein